MGFFGHKKQECGDQRVHNSGYDRREIWLTSVTYIITDKKMKGHKWDKMNEEQAEMGNETPK